MVRFAVERRVDERELPGLGARELDAEAGLFRRLHPFAQPPGAGQVQSAGIREPITRRVPAPANDTAASSASMAGSVGAAPAAGEFAFQGVAVAADVQVHVWIATPTN